MEPPAEVGGGSGIMAYGTKYTATLEGRTLTWTINVQLEGYSGSTITLDVLPGAKLQYEYLNGDRETCIITSRLPASFIDPDDLLYDDLSDVTKSDRDFLLVLTATGYEWRGYLRLDTVERTLFPSIESPVTQVYAYDGLEDTTEDPSPTATLTCHELVKKITYDQLALNIRYVQGWRPDNLGSGAIMDLMRLNELTFPDESCQQVTSRAIISFDGLLWQTFSQSGGEWRVQQSFSVGELIGPGTRAHQLFDGSTMSEQGTDLAANTSSVTASDWNQSTKTREEPRLRSLDTSLNTGLDAGTLYVQRNGGFEQWPDTIADGWDGTFTKETTTTHTGSNSAKLDGTVEASQELMWGRVGSDIIPRMSFWMYQEPRGANVNVKARYQVRIVGYQGSGDTYYLDANGDWTTTQTRLRPAISDSAWANVTMPAPNDGWPRNGVLEVIFEGDSGDTDHILYVDDVEAEIQDIGDNTPTVEPLEQRFTGDSYGPRREVAVLPEVQDGTQWFFAIYDGTSWTSALAAGETNWASGEPSTTNTDSKLVELLADSRTTDEASERQVIRGELWGIHPPEQAITFDSTTYRVFDELEISLADEITTGTWIEKVKTFN